MRTDLQRDPNDLTGQQCGGSYIIERLLGAGGMGQVWLAKASELDGKEAAVKVLSGDALARPEHLARFKTEVRAVGGLRDHNVVEVWDAGTLADGRHYMIMEFCSAGSLSGLLEKKRWLSVEETFMYLAGPASALAAAHATKIIHRDFKPDNILLVYEDGRVRAKLGDFGIAKLTVERLDAQPKGRTQGMIGTPGYMAPEQANPKAGIDHRADIYSLGCVLYQCLTGQLPYPTTHFLQYLEALGTRRPIARLRALRPDIPSELDVLVMTCLEYERARRVQTVDEVMQRFALAIPNGLALLQFFAPRFVDRATAPTATTISESVGAAATKFVSEMSISVHRQRRASIRNIAVAFIAGALCSGGAAVFASRFAARPDAGAEAGANAATATPPPNAFAPAVPSAPLPPVARVRDDATVGARVEPQRISASASLDASTKAPVSSTLAGARAEAPRAPAPPPLNVPTSPKNQAPTLPLPVMPPAKNPSAAATGELVVSVDPYAEVWLDNKPIGPTPISVRVRIGQHRLRLTNKDLGIEKSVGVTITEDKPMRIEESW
jgi:serine/threonine protein kinase